MSSRIDLAWQPIVGLELMLFLGLWLICGMFINTKTISDYGQPLIEAIVDQQRFTLENLRSFPMKDDVFGYEGHTYSNKNPGQAIIGSIAYAHLRLLGISYERDKFFAGALVIFFSTGLFTAFGAVALCRLARDLSGRRTIVWPLAAALVWALCTTQLPFAAVAWHDPLASAMLIMALYFLYKVRDNSLSPEMARNLAILSGFLLGMILTTSMSFFFMVGLFGVYFLTLRRWNLLIPFFTAAFVGIVPMLIYNTINFHNPFTSPYVMFFRYSGYPVDVYFFLDWDNFVGKVLAYFNQINWYSPILWLGFAGLFLLPARVRREQLFILGAIAVLLFYMLNVEGLGVCGYGPRYLLPIMPLCSLGIIGLGRVPTKVFKLLMATLVFWIAFVSFRVNVVGLMGGALYCNYAACGYQEYVHRLTTGPLPQYPILGILLPFFVLWCIWAVYSQSLFGQRRHRESASM